MKAHNATINDWIDETKKIKECILTLISFCNYIKEISGHKMTKYSISTQHTFILLNKIIETTSSALDCTLKNRYLSSLILLRASYESIILSLYIQKNPDKARERMTDEWSIRLGNIMKELFSGETLVEHQQFYKKLSRIDHPKLDGCVPYLMPPLSENQICMPIVPVYQKDNAGDLLVVISHTLIEDINMVLLVFKDEIKDPNMEKELISKLNDIRQIKESIISKLSE